ncbi:MAG: hypothetical protein Q4G27_06735 [Flavobacteriaceae bacterium]|nr:hypothetical protein [Flavobacteriaceae bacterium]
MKSIRNILLFTSIIIASIRVNAQHDSIQAYVQFLEQPHLTAKDYIISLYDKYDIVIFCERFHGELTQYELLVDLFADPRFQNQVGHIYMEMGGSNWDKTINNYLHAKNLTEKESRKRALFIQQNAMWYPLWDRYNYHYLLTSLYKINSKLPKNQKLSLHPTDIAIDWNKILTAEDVQKNITGIDVQNRRDSAMANNFTRIANEVKQKKEKRQKHFVILNTAHSLPVNYEVMSLVFEPASKMIAERFPGKTAGVLLNYEGIPVLHSTAEQGNFPPILNGKWDAAMLWIKKDDIGFDLEGSPLGDEIFENMPLENPGLKNKEVYKGYVYYKHYPAFTEANGVPGIVDEQFLEELYRRYTIFYGPTTTPKEKVLADYKRLFGQKNVEPTNDLIAYWQKVRQWDPPKNTAPRVGPFNFVEDKMVEALLLTFNRITPAIAMQVQQAAEKNKLEIKLSPAPKVVHQLNPNLVAFDSKSNEIHISSWDQLPSSFQQYLTQFSGDEKKAKELFGLTNYGYLVFHEMGKWLQSQKGNPQNTYEADSAAHQFAVAFLRNIGQEENLKKLYDNMKAGLINKPLKIPAGANMKDYIRTHYSSLIQSKPEDYFAIQAMQLIEIMNDLALPPFEEIVKRQLSK